MNGYYITLEGLEEKLMEYPSFFEGEMQFNRPFELNIITLYELKTISINILGRPASELPIKISYESMITQLNQNINSYWTTWIKNHSLFNLGYFILVLYPRLTEWGVLGVARQLYTLETQGITSKYKAGLYCLGKLSKKYHDIISIAIEARKTNKTMLYPSFKRATKTLECMKYIIQEFNKSYREKKMMPAHVREAYKTPCSDDIKGHKINDF